MVGVHDHAEDAAPIRVDRLTPVQRLRERAQARPVRGHHRVQGFEGERDPHLARPLGQGRHAVTRLAAGVLDVALANVQAADDEHVTRRAEFGGDVQCPRVVVDGARAAGG